MPTPTEKVIEMPAPWPKFLKELDEALKSEVKLVCIGGFVLTALYGIPRTTGDLDYLEVYPSEAYPELEELAGRDSALAKKHRVCLQRVTGVVDLPEDYEERRMQIATGLKNISIYAVESIDLVLSKLTRNSPKDREDVKFLAAKVGLNFADVKERYDKEMKPWIPNADRHDTTLNVVWKDLFPTP